MSLVRAIARPLLASQFVYGGIMAFRDPGPRTAPAAEFAQLAQKVAPQLPSDPELLVRANAAAQTVGGLMLATGRYPRISSAVLAGSLVPTTLFGHPFWRETDPARRGQQKIHFFKNLSMLGGLLLATVDTEGRPGLAWRTKHAITSTIDEVGDARERLTDDVRQRAQLVGLRARLLASRAS